MYQKKLSQIKEHLIAEASLVQNMLRKSMEGIWKRDVGLLHEVIEQDEPNVNGFDIEIDRMCTQVAALYQPGPKDLRILLTMLKANYDLERMGDHAVNIAQSGVDILPYDASSSEEIVNEIFQASISMVEDAVRAFIMEDEELAFDVLRRDDLVDSLRDRCVHIFSEKLKEEPQLSQVYLHLVRIVRSIERVADLATNIAEYALFVIKGEIKKHGKEELL